VSLSSKNDGIKVSNLGRKVSLTLLYLEQKSRKCSSSSMCCRSQCLQILCALSVHVCLCRPLSISRSSLLYLERICLYLNCLINRELANLVVLLRADGRVTVYFGDQNSLLVIDHECLLDVCGFL